MKKRKNKHIANENVKMKKIMLSLGLIILFRFLTHIPAPFMRSDILKVMRDNFLMISVFSGGAFNGLTLLATGVSSYITSSIIMQLLASSFETLHTIQRTPGGKVQIDSYKRKLAYMLSILTSFGLIRLFDVKYQAFGKTNMLLVYTVIIIYHLIGTYITIKIADKIEDDGIGNGLSILIFINIISKFPKLIKSNVTNFNKASDRNMFLLSLAFLVIMFILIIICEKSERRIKLSFGKVEIYKNSVFDEKHSYFPFRLNMGGVMPLILSATFISILTFAYDWGAKHYGKTGFFSATTEQVAIASIIITSIFIFIFAFMYTELIVNPIDISEDIMSRGATIENVNHGYETVKFLDYTLKGLTLAGATYLFLVSLIPSLVFRRTNFTSLGVTSIIIIISVSCAIVDSLDIIKDNR